MLSLKTIRPNLRLAARAPRGAVLREVPRMAMTAQVPRVRRTLATDAPTLDFDPHAKMSMDKQSPPEPGSDFRVVIVGAGNINFGSEEGPWNHSFRLEHKLGPRLKVVALIDPDTTRARHVLDTKCSLFVRSAYEDTQVFPDLDSYMTTVTNSSHPHAIWVGSPPEYRGGTAPGRDLEYQLAQKLPGVPLFIEKPVATGPVDEAEEVATMLKKSGTIVSVGYMLRYMKLVQKMKQILLENNLKVMSINARYIMAYEHTAKLAWWDKSKNPGPIVEQATHFCDLMRYFGGDPELSTVMAHSLEAHEPAGVLSKMPVDESLIAPENRIPRVTCATWKFESGAVGSLTHAVALQGTEYQTEFDVFADGYSMRLVDPYNNPALYLRRPGDDHEEVIRYRDDDPFFSEVSNLIDNIEKGEGSVPILSTYEDAVKSYALTWAIRKASESNVKPH